MDTDSRKVLSGALRRAPARMGRKSSAGVWRTSLARVPATVLLALFLWGAFSQIAAAAEQVKLTAGFTPDRRGARTTIVFGFQISTGDGTPPSPVSSVDLRLPAGMGLATTSLGLATCTPELLVAHGLQGCPSNARIGYGSAVVEVPLGPELIKEKAGISALLGEAEGSALEVLFYANGLSPVFAQLVFPAQLLPDSGSFGGRINTAVPTVPVLPEGANASVVDFTSTIGPRHLTYYKRVHGRRVPFHPRGALVPKVCPHGGYPFAGAFVFQDGSRVTASSRVPCPTH
jgi:hypothetical protein